jgi:hypothetical protein
MAALTGLVAVRGQNLRTYQNAWLIQRFEAVILFLVPFDATITVPRSVEI